jgi:hypothetical protein
MNPLRMAAWVGALLALMAGGGSARAGWDNVFQVCCHHCGSSAAVSGYYAPSVSAYYNSSYSAYMAATTPADPCCNPCPQTVCTTRYVQRCYYQPVTCYQTRSYYEPVTSYQTSYYYEPVCSYRYSCYYDPCTCSYQQVATPVTSYRLRSQCNAVTSYVQRCQLVPVTTYQQAFYWEPQTTCCSTTPGAAPVVVAAPGQVQAPAGVSEGRIPPQAGIAEGRLAPQPGVAETPGAQQQPQQQQGYYPPQNPMPPPGGTSFRQALPPAAPRVSTPPPKVRLDRIVSLPATGVQGQVIHADNRPWPNVRLVFVSAERPAVNQQAVTADAAGRFQVSLASGGWHVYVPGADGKLALHSKIDLRQNETRQVMLVSR